MRTVIDTATPAVKEAKRAVEKLTEKGIRKTVKVAVYRIPVAKRFARRGVVRVTPVVRRATIATKETTKSTARTVAKTTRDATQTTTQAVEKVTHNTSEAVNKAAKTTTKKVGKVLPRRKSAEDTADPGTPPQD